MNDREKVMSAINCFESTELEIVQLQANLDKKRRQLDEARRHVAKTLRAVYGDRAEHGVIYGQRWYKLAGAADGVQLVLVVDEMKAEVMSNVPDHTVVKVSA